MRKDPIKVNALELRNRIVMPPMATGKAVNGMPDDALLSYYAARAEATALIIVEHEYVSSEGMAHGNQLSMAEDAVIPAYQRLTDAIHARGAAVFAQLHHAGVRAQDSGRPAIGPSGISLWDPDSAARTMTMEDIARVKECFVSAALRAKEAGFDGVELHSAHGYLLNQFYSPLTNHRTDDYSGQTLAGRTRLHAEILRSVRAAVGSDYPIAIRFGACDYMEGGSQKDDIPEASRIFAHDCGEVAAWVPEGGEIPLQDAMEDFSTIPVDSHKLAVFVKMDEEFVHDASFGMEDYLLKRFAKNFAKAEDYGFLNGTGDGMPTGLLDPEKGAEIGANTAGLSFDDLIKLYSSVKPEYRKNGAWLMNDDTALVLRTLKDENGAYIWNSEKDTLLGKPVIIAEGMPNAEAGKLPVLFGDFRYYWVVRRSPVRVRTLKEKFVRYSQIGYLAIEYMDGKLVRRDAVKALKITA